MIAILDVFVARSIKARMSRITTLMIYQSCSAKYLFISLMGSTPAGQKKMESSSY
jgi:hypothetical protein